MVQEAPIYMPTGKFTFRLPEKSNFGQQGTPAARGGVRSMADRRGALSGHDIQNEEIPRIFGTFQCQGAILSERSEFIAP